VKLVPILDWLSQLLRVGAFLIDIDINIVEQFTIFAKQPLPNPWKLSNQVAKALTNCITIDFDYCLVIGKVKQIGVNVYYYTHFLPLAS
jgi:hypothetical protein